MTAEIENSSEKGDIIKPKLQLIAWELTRTCNLFCAHCRGSASDDHYRGELSTEECFRLIDQILEVGKPIIILTGGEPLARPDVLTIGKYAASQGLRVVMGSNGTLITEEMAAKLKDVPLARLGVSLDFPVARLQDDFRGQAGAFAAAVAGIAHARQAGIEIQINSTITRRNVGYLDELLALAIELGAVAFHPFMLVPTGRGKGLESVELSPEEYEKTLNWIYDKQMDLGDRIFFKPTDVPHYMRVMKQRQKQSGQLKSETTAGQRPMHTVTRGCLAGTGFCFISYQGEVKGCGFLDVVAGSVKKANFSQIWSDSPLFCELRDLSNLKGKCGVCEYKRICGGCRARAYEASGDCLEAEPYCLYEPTLPARDLARIDG
ncbi:MAG: radical SAM protein [Chloroflexi bacterium]|nr:radical SAM protein [Chloroflexota bacterium]